MKQYFTLLFTAFILCITTLYAQQTYKKSFGGVGGGEWQDDIKQMKDGGYLLTGSTENFGAGNYDAYCVKLNKAGEMLWSKTYGTALGEKTTKCHGTADGGFIFSFITYIPQGKQTGLFIVKCDVNGAIQWSKFMKNTHQVSIEPAYIYESKQGDYYVLCDWYAGYYDYTGFGLIKLGSNGDLIWKKAVDAQPLAFFNSTQVSELNNGDIIVAGNSGGDNWDTYGSYIHLFLLSSETGSIKQCKKITLGNGGYNSYLYLTAFVVENNKLYISGGYSRDGFYFKECGFSVKPKETQAQATGIAFKNFHCSQYLRNKGIIKQPEGGYSSAILFTDDGGYIRAYRYYISEPAWYDMMVDKFDSLGRICSKYAIPKIDTTIRKAIVKITDKSYELVGCSIIIKDSVLTVTDVTAQTIGCTDTAPDENRMVTKEAAPLTINKNHFTVYPNPTSNFIHIQTNGIADIILINSDGKVLRSKTINNSDVLNVSSFANDLYYIKNKATGEVQKIVIVH